MKLPKAKSTLSWSFSVFLPTFLFHSSKYRPLWRCRGDSSLRPFLTASLDLPNNITLLFQLLFIARLWTSSILYSLLILFIITRTLSFLTLTLSHLDSYIRLFYSIVLFITCTGSLCLSLFSNDALSAIIGRM